MDIKKVIPFIGKSVHITLKNPPNLGLNVIVYAVDTKDKTIEIRNFKQTSLIGINAVESIIERAYEIRFNEEQCQRGHIWFRHYGWESCFFCNKKVK